LRKYDPLGFPEKRYGPLFFVVSAPYTETLGIILEYKCKASFSASPETLRLQIGELLIFGPRVSRVSAEILVLGFLQLIEGFFKLTSVLLTFKAYSW
jgi:hypothetical protein